MLSLIMRMVKNLMALPRQAYDNERKKNMKQENKARSVG